MCARRFLLFVFFMILLVVAGAVAIFQFGDRILIKQAVPTGHFEAAEAGSGPDYSTEAAWMAKPGLEEALTQWTPEGARLVDPITRAETHVFYIHPTTYLERDRWNAPLHSGGFTESRTRLFVRSQASAFGQLGDVWAPRYRQAAYGSFLLKSEDADQALGLAYSDVSAAFDQFVKQNPDGRIILAGHSQGALHLERLLRERVAGKPIAKRIVAAYVVGWPISTKSDLPGATGSASQGGYDNYLTGFATDIAGTPKALFTTHFGSAENDTVSGIVVDGGKVIVASKEGSQAKLRSFDVATTVVTENRTSLNSAGIYETKAVTYTKAATMNVGAVRDLGTLKGGDIAGISIDNGQLYIGGYTTNGELSVGNVTSAASGGSDGFVARISLDLTDTADDTMAYYGGTGDDTVTGMAVSNGQVWLVGAAGKDLAGLPTVGTKDGYVAQIDMDTGAATWEQRLTGKDGYATPTSIAVDASGSSALDVFGLPRGAMNFTQSDKIVSATSARPGDTFQIRTRERGPLTTITISANDTLETLADKIRRASGSAAKVSITSDGNMRKLSITPAFKTSTVEILPGKGDSDVLDALGLAAGVVRNTKTESGRTVSADGKGPVYGLKLNLDMSLADAESRATTADLLKSATAAIRNAYREMADIANGVKVDTSSTKSNTTGTAPAYLTNQIANYQAALDRLTGG